MGLVSDLFDAITTSVKAIFWNGSGQYCRQSVAAICEEGMA